MWTKFGLKLLRKFEMRTSGGGGGVVSDFGHPRTRGGGGVKKGQIFADVLYGWPLILLSERKIHVAKYTHKLFLVEPKFLNDIIIT